MDRRRVPPRLSLVALATSAAASAFAFANTAHAQVGGWALDRYEPNPAGDIFFASDFPWYNRTRLFAVGLVADYARDPLVLYASNGETARRIIDSQGVLHVQGTLALFDRIGINFSLPISLFQTGEPSTPATTTNPALQAYTPPVSGDIRLGIRVRIVGQSDRDPISLHIGGHAYLGFIPYNDNTNFVTDEAFRFRAYATLAGHAGPIRWSFTGGFHYRPTLALLGTSIAPDVYINAAIGFASEDGRLTVGPEAWASYTLNGNDFARSVSAEALLGIHYSILDTLLLGIGAGPGVSDGAPGTPEFRALLRLAYAPTPRVEPPRPPPPADSDNDNVIDLDDACPHEPMGTNPDPDRLGCPLHDSDHDGVGDTSDQCPNQPAGEHPDPQRAGCPEADTDSDGVFDRDDQCVTTPAGAHPDPERPGCPDADTDNDGVLDHDDQCRTVHSGPHPDASRPGCPLPDRDHDSVPDNTDHCPDQPGAPHPDPNRNGCPGLVRVEGGQVRILQQVFFATNSDRILPRSFPVLQAVADALRASPDIRRVAIEGHTDNQGDDTRNLQLSDRRANSVMAWLTHHSIDAARLEAHGYGETRPLASNDTGPGRAQNRRVEFHITDPAPASSAPPASAPSTAPASAAPASTSPAPSSSAVPLE